MSSRKKLSPAQSEKLLKTLKLASRKTWRAIKASNGPGFNPSSKPILRNFGPSMRWKERAANPTSSATTRKRANTPSSIAPRKLLPARRSVCYDREGLESRKEFKPENNAIDMAAAMGIELLTEDEYYSLQKLGTFDEKTSSWLKTPPDFRKQGGALFGDRRYGRVFIYQNSAHTYYRVRAFRASLKV